MKHGTTAIHNLQTGIYTPTPLGDVKPSECDLSEHEEIVIWSDEFNTWVQPDPEPTEEEKAIMDIEAYLGAALDRLEDLKRERK